MTSARIPDPLLLPFQTSCWRADVDHSVQEDPAGPLARDPSENRSRRYCIALDIARG